MPGAPAGDDGEVDVVVTVLAWLWLGVCALGVAGVVLLLVARYLDEAAAFFRRS